MKKKRIKRAIVVWQTKDQGANPLTSKGKKWIEKEIKRCDEKKLRKQLEEQNFEESDKTDAYWKWVETHSENNEGTYTEMPQANPDVLSDEDYC